MSEKKIAIYVDADACPVKDEILKVAYRHKLVVYFVSNQWMRMETGPLVQKIVVPDGPDEADNWIADNINALWYRYYIRYPPCQKMSGSRRRSNRPNWQTIFAG